MKQAVLEKGAEAVRTRLRALGIDDDRRDGGRPRGRQRLAGRSLAEAARREADLTLILTGSATSDRGDVGPAALVAAGGRLTRFGMPVDPGNLLFLGELGGRPVIGLPGCARSPKLNGADWVIERLACGLDVSSEDIAAMGVGGLAEGDPVPARAARRRRDRAAAPGGRGRAAGGGIGAADGRARQAARAGRRRAAAAHAGRRGSAPARSTRSSACCRRTTRRAGRRWRARAARVVPNPRAAEGMGTSIAAGSRRSARRWTPPSSCWATCRRSPAAGCRPADRRLRPGRGPRHRARRQRRRRDRRAPGAVRPALLRGAARVSRATAGRAPSWPSTPEFVVDVTLAGRAAETDLDTPEAWERWRSEQPA